MAEGGPPTSLVLALGTFHAASLVTVGVLALHRSGGVGDLLVGSDTTLGFALFLVLWAASSWTTRRALADVDVGASLRLPPLRRLVVAGAGWGAAAGLLAVAAVIVPVVLQSLPGLRSLAFFLAIAGLVAATVGAVVGVAFAVLDAVAVTAARVLVPEPGAGG